MNRRQKTHRYVNNFLKENPEHHLKYNELLKEARIWNGMSQYWLGDEATRRAKCLLNGDISGYEQVKYSDQLYFQNYL